LNQNGPTLFQGVFLYGEEGIPMQANRVINRFTNFKDDQLLIWLMHHENRELVRIEGVTLPLYGDWSFNFWHWCTETLPMALVAHEGGFTGTYLVPDLPFVTDTLKLLGIAPERIRTADGSDYYLDCMCLLPKRRGYDGSILEPLLRVRSILRSAFAQRNRKQNLYISRNGNPGNSRQVVNHEALLDLLKRHDFVTLQMEDLSLDEQLAHTCNAGALIGPHGAGMTHCIFMPERSLVLELFAPTYINPCLLLPCRSLSHRYFQITSHCSAGYAHGLDIEAHLQMIELTLERELSPTAAGPRGNGSKGSAAPA
jgi:capsular polysaccharide biosynthesis protein